LVNTRQTGLYTIN